MRSSATGTKAIRVGEDLVALAEQYAVVAHRSTPKQIELWAQLGRLTEAALHSSDLHALLCERKFIAEIRLGVNVEIDADAVLSRLRRAQTDGTLAARVTDAEVVYDIADDGETLRRTDVDGRVTLGSVVDGEFLGHPG